MLQKLMLNQKTWQKVVMHTVIFLTVCTATFGFLLCCGALVIVRIDTPDYVLVPITTALMTFSSFIDSFLLGKVYKENGLIIGAATGGLFVLIIVILALFYRSFALTPLLLSKVCAVMAAGLLGGILGVNS